MSDRILVLRTPSGISGDMLLAGMARIAGQDDRGLAELVGRLALEALHGCLSVDQVKIDGITGWKASINLPHEHVHRSCSDIRALIRASELSSRAKDLAESVFAELAKAEGAIHGKSADEVTFHEVGALDSILDICLVSAMFDRISPDRFVCSPLPVCDGIIRCEHGLHSAPAPAVLHMLNAIPVYGIDSIGETITPTAIALLKVLGATFDRWPPLTVEKVERIFGGRIIPNVPNGAVFVLGISHGLEYCAGPGDVPQHYVAVRGCKD